MDKPTIYLLSIGINEYASDDIANLNGCEKDVSSFQRLLIDLDFVSRKNCKTLLSKEATRARIIQTFRSHFNQLGDSDIALFHFSGHGSSEKADTAFIRAGYESPGGRNETLVCYDSKTSGVFNIADKELRLLIAEIQYKKKNTPFIAIIDCCHSGSMLRDEQLRARTTASQKMQRSLVDYLEGQYQTMLNQNNSIVLPSIDYLLLTACSPKEYAYENKDGGFFTNTIISLLSKKHLELSYAELYTQTRRVVHHKSRNRQHPYIEYSGDMNPFQLFLQHSLASNINMPVLEKKDADWVVNIGAIHGIEPKPSLLASFPIYLEENLEQAIGRAMIKEVFVEETTVSTKWNYEPPGPQEELCIGLCARPIPISLQIENGATHTPKQIKKVLDRPIINNQFILQEKAIYELYARENQLLLCINDKDESKLLIGLEEESLKAFDWLVYSLQAIAKWENILQLNTPKYSKIDLASITFIFSYWNDFIPKSTLLVGTKAENPDAVEQITIPVNSDIGAVFYEIEVKHHHNYTHGLYFYLVHLDRKYQIVQKSEQYTKRIMKNVRQKLYNSEGIGIGLGISDSLVNEVEDSFILIASETQLMNPHYFHQPGFKDDFKKIVTIDSFQKSKEEVVVKNNLQRNWIVKKLRVKLVRE